MKYKLFVFVFLLFVGILLAACQDDAAVAVIPAIAEMKEDTISVSTTVMPTIKSSETKQPSVISIGTMPPTPGPSKTITQTSTIDHTLQARESAMETRFAALLTSTVESMFTVTAAVETLAARNVVCEEGLDFEYLSWNVLTINEFISNNDAWTLVNCKADSEESTVTGNAILINQDNTKRWTIDKESLGLYDFELLYGFYLDKERDFLYLSADMNGEKDGFSPEYLIGHGGRVYRMDLQTGDLVTLFPVIYGAKDGTTYYDVTFSPDYETIAFATSLDPHTVKLMHAANGQVIETIDLMDDEIIYVSGFTWTSDQHYLIYVAGYKGWEEGENGLSLYRLDMETMENVELIHNDKRYMVPSFYGSFPRRWFEGEILNLMSVEFWMFDNPYQYDHWKLNILTGELTE